MTRLRGRLVVPTSQRSTTTKELIGQNIVDAPSPSTKMVILFRLSPLAEVEGEPPALPGLPLDDDVTDVDMVVGNRILTSNRSLKRQKSRFDLLLLL
jgi:hypothetical protein